MSKKRSTTERPAANPEEIPQWIERRPLTGKTSSLRQKLYLKAKREPNFRFYALYDRIYRLDVLMAAWEQVRRNKGAPGVDGVTIDQIVNAEDGPGQLVRTLQEELRNKTYRPLPVKRKRIPKADGRERPLGIPTVRDRVVQMAAKLILEPIFEADFKDCSYGFRPDKSAHQALGKIKEHLQKGYRDVYDADLKAYFDTIPHDKLIKALRMRIVDRSVLKLIRMWLTATVVDEREGGPPKKQRQGTPQGGVISPLLANVYLHWFDYLFQKETGPAGWAKAKLVRYADDFVVLARYQGKQLTSWIESTLEERMGLTVNREKTSVVRMNEAGAQLHFLGFTFRYDKDRNGGDWRYLNLFPSKKALAKEREKLRSMTDKRVCFMPIPAMIEEVNRHLRGWANYFKFGYPRKAFREINSYTRLRLCRHLRRRSQRPFRPPEGESMYAHFKRMGLIYL